MAAMCALSILHVGVLVDDDHHVGDGLGVGLEHLPPKYDAMEALVEVVDHVPVISFRNCITVSKVPFDVIAQGLGRPLRDAAQIPSGFGARAGCLIVLDKGVAEVLPAVYLASWERLEL